MMEILPWVVQEAYLGARSHLGGTKEKGPYFVVFESICFTYFPLHSSDFFYVQQKGGHCLYVGMPCFGLGYDGDLHTHT